ncbi:hypothetical protein GVO57_04135 [Sphingomonas changnyeongensis]|uniref:Uncharacterized protein n=1 Tax=Sphingomonas changnyeongensis TaxID=2698679 RepID=A0A7Z2NUR4_9SPHN|nr:hypothetical protein [Sphingomonas changnyeongensis]QHL90171.1 hypothetical protein GVO57_04135 [Sphingomonas changnyeongensis]
MARDPRRLARMLRVRTVARDLARADQLRAADQERAAADLAARLDALHREVGPQPGLAGGWAWVRRLSIAAGWPMAGSRPAGAWPRPAPRMTPRGPPPRQRHATVRRSKSCSPARRPSAMPLRPARSNNCPMPRVWHGPC